MFANSRCGPRLGPRSLYSPDLQPTAGKILSAGSQKQVPFTNHILFCSIWSTDSPHFLLHPTCILKLHFSVKHFLWHLYLSNKCIQIKSKTFEFKHRAKIHWKYFSKVQSKFLVTLHQWLCFVIFLDNTWITGNALKIHFPLFPPL